MGMRMAKAMNWGRSSGSWMSLRACAPREVLRGTYWDTADARLESSLEDESMRGGTIRWMWLLVKVREARGGVCIYPAQAYQRRSPLSRSDLAQALTCF